MSSVRVVPFNALPKVVRERFISTLSDSGRTAPPVLSDKATFWWGLIGSTLLLIGAAGIGLFVFFTSFDNPFGSDAIQGWGFSILYGVALFLVLLSGLLLFRIVMRRRALPFRAGRYLFPLDFVDARTETLRITPMTDLIDYGVVHHYHNGSYTHSVINFTFGNAPAVSFQLRGQDLVNQAMEMFFQNRNRIGDAVERRDEQALAGLDPFHEVRRNDSWKTLKATPGGQFTDGPIAGDVPRIGKWILISIVPGAMIGFGMFWIHNYLIDGLRFRELARLPRVANCRVALRDGTRFKAEIEKLLPPAALREARQAKTVTAFRGVVKEFPNTPEAAEAKTLIHGAFVDSMTRFRQLAASSDPKMMPFMEELVAYLEQHDSPPIVVRFRRPLSADLEKADAFYQEKLKGKIFIPIAPNFSVKVSDAREAVIRNQLIKGFSTCFANDVLSFQAGPNVGEERLTPASLTAPVIEIVYEVSPSEKTYVEEGSERVVVGIRIAFDMRLMIPKKSDDFSFGLIVEPPSRFYVEYDSPGQAAGQVGAARIYEQMATRAFDQFSGKLRDVFFKPSDGEESKTNGKKKASE